MPVRWPWRFGEAHDIARERPGRAVTTSRRTSSAVATALALVITALATFVFYQRGVNIGVAVLGYLGVILLAGRLGATPVVVVGVTSCIALNVWFVAPVGSFQLVKS